MSNPARAIVTARPAAYLRRVSLARLIRFLTILALVLSPLAMFGAAPASATAHHAAMAADSHRMAGHAMAGDMASHASMAAMPNCQDTDGPTKDRPCESSDCLTACAAVPALPAVGGQLEPHAMAHGLRELPALVSVPHGLVPEAATPPPREFLTI
ncbi:MAG: hypothetical protein ACXW27_08855 [Allosphingosinicella sp.]